MNHSGRIHFSSAKQGRFPQALLYCCYETNDKSDDVLIAKSNHTRGQLVDFDIHLGRWDITNENVSSILKLFRDENLTITDLNLSGNDQITMTMLIAISNELRESIRGLKISKIMDHQTSNHLEMIDSILSFPKLTFLDISHNSQLVDDSFIDIIVTNLPNISKLSISGCSLLSDHSLFHIADKVGSNLIELNAADISGFTDIGAKDIIQKCVNLIELNFENCRGITFIGSIINGVDGQYLYCSRKLRHIVINNCNQLIENSLKWLCVANPELITIEMNNVPFLSEESLLGLIFNCPSITLLHVSRCIRITGISIRAISNKCSLIKDLDISYIDSSKFNSADVIEVLMKCSKLTKLDLSGNYLLSDEMFTDLPVVKLGSTVSQNVSSIENTININGGEINLKPLKLVHSTANKAIYSDQLMKRGIIPLPLTWLSIEKCGFSGYGVLSLAERCTYLQHLNISGLMTVTDSVITGVVTCCRGLRHLYLNDCDLVTDQGVIVISYGLLLLQTLHLSSSKDFRKDSSGDPILHYQYTDDALEALLDGARKLRTLCLRNQNGIKMEAKWFQTRFVQRAGHFKLQSIDLTGVHVLDLQGAIAVFSHCTNLSEVKLSRRLPTVFRSKKFWMAAFSKSVYSLSYDDTKRINFHNDLKRQSAIALATGSTVGGAGGKIAQSGFGNSHFSQSFSSLPSDEGSIVDLQQGFINGVLSTTDVVGAIQRVAVSGVAIADSVTENEVNVPFGGGKSGKRTGRQSNSVQWKLVDQKGTSTGGNDDDEEILGLVDEGIDEDEGDEMMGNEMSVGNGRDILYGENEGEINRYDPLTGLAEGKNPLRYAFGIAEGTFG